MSAVDVHVPHGGGDPFVAEELLDGDDVHAVAIKRGRALVPQHVGLSLPRQAGKCRATAWARPASSVSALTRHASPSAVLRSEHSSGAPGWSLRSSNWPRTSVTNHSSSGRLTDQRRDPLLGAAAARVLADADVQLAQRPGLPQHVGHVQTAGFPIRKPTWLHSRAAA